MRQARVYASMTVYQASMSRWCILHLSDSQAALDCNSMQLCAIANRVAYLSGSASRELKRQLQDATEDVCGDTLQIWPAAH